MFNPPHCQNALTHYSTFDSFIIVFNHMSEQEDNYQASLHHDTRVIVFLMAVKNVQIIHQSSYNM